MLLSQELVHVPLGVSVGEGAELVEIAVGQPDAAQGSVMAAPEEQGIEEQGLVPAVIKV
jgi:hypothetical protein